MLRTLAGRGLLRSQGTKILIGTTNGSSNNGNNKFNSTLAQPSQVSYDWVNRENNSHFKFNKERSETEFDKLLAEIKERFIREEIPAKHRNFVFRPRNADLLKNSPFRDRDGNAYDPKVWKGIPSSKQLIQLIRRATDNESFSISKDILQKYIKHYPQQVKSQHIVTFLRVAARTGNLYDAFDLIQTSSFKQLIDRDVAMEIVRLYAIRAVTLNKHSAYKDLTRLANKFKDLISSSTASNESTLELTLLVIYGIAPFKQLDPSEFEKIASPLLASLPGLLENFQVTDPQTSDISGLTYRYYNFVLGRLGLGTLGDNNVDISIIDTEIKALEDLMSRNKQSAPLERYVKHASIGILEAYERAIPKTNEDSAEASE